MSNGHPNRRRGGAHARHGPQRQERAAPNPAANGVAPSNSRSAQNGSGASIGAKKQAKESDSRATSLPPPTPSTAAPVSATPNASPNAGDSPATRQKAARGARPNRAMRMDRSAESPTPRPAPAPLPVVRRRGGPVIVPPTARQTAGDAANQPQRNAANGQQQEQAAHPGAPDAFIISLAHRELELAIEPTALQAFTHEVDTLDTVVEIDETDEIDEIDTTLATGDTVRRASRVIGEHYERVERIERIEASAYVEDGDGSDVSGADDAGLHSQGLDGADTSPALAATPPPTPAPRARLGRFYAPGGPMRPDESWVERTAANAPANTSAGSIADDASSQEEYGLGGEGRTPMRWEHVEHFDHSARVGPRDEVGRLIDSLHSLFEQDRAVASQGGTARCGVCYLHFALADLDYRDSEGFYVCANCERSLGSAQIPMVRRQQR